MSRTTRRKGWHQITSGKHHNYFNPAAYIKKTWGHAVDWEYEYTPWGIEFLHRDRSRAGWNIRSYVKYIYDQTRNDCRKEMTKVRQGKEHFDLTPRQTRVLYRGWGWNYE